MTVFRAPLSNGAVPFVHLYELRFYVYWIFSHPDVSAGINLKVAVEHVSFHDLAVSGANKGLIQRDYELLDKIHPEWVQSLKQWMEKVEYTGEYKLVVKTYRTA